MADTPDISVVIASYNAGRYIARAVSSALNQQGVSVEVIVVDDGSTDDTRAILSAIADPRLRIIVLESNAGPGAARNAGFAAARGRWIAVLDGDDAFADGRLSRFLLRAQAHQADLVIDNLALCREDGGAQAPMFSPEPYAKLGFLQLPALIRGTLPDSGSYTLGYAKPVFSAAFLRRHKLAYDPSVRIGEDYLLLAECLCLGARCAVEPAAGYLYTVRKGSVSHRWSSHAILRMMEADARLLSRHALDADAARAQDERTLMLQKEYAFALLVESIKRKNIFGILKAIGLRPSCAFLLWRPLKARMARLRPKGSPA